MSSSQRSSKQFPVANAVPSYWRKHPAAIDTHRSTADLVAYADIVVIGAGYSGASIVHHLVEENLRAKRAIPSILILEAREACSGATGRNGTYTTPSFNFQEHGINKHRTTSSSGNGVQLGGHLKPDPLLRAAGLLDSHGVAVAEHVASFEQRQVEAIKNLVQRERIDCDFEETTVMDVCKYASGRDKMKANIDKITQAGISTAKSIHFFTGSEAEKVSVHTA
jgi:glycine/D-amino acid oxidase-like deaminating enzyme